MVEVLTTSVELGSEQDQGHRGPDEDTQPHLEANEKPLKVKQGDQNYILERSLWGQLEVGPEIVTVATCLLTIVTLAEETLNILSPRGLSNSIVLVNAWCIILGKLYAYLENIVLRSCWKSGRSRLWPH